MRLLPHWVLTDRFPAFYDTDSGSAIEQTAKVYAAMQELITEYNGFVDEINKAIEENRAGVFKSIEDFKICITKIVSNYIGSVDLKLKSQNRIIAETIIDIKENLSATISATVSEMDENGELDAAIISALNGVNAKLAEFDGINERIDAVEDAIPYYVFNEETEALELMNVEVREV